MELYIIHAEEDPLAQEPSIEVGVIADSSDQAMRLASGYYTSLKKYCFQCEETNVAVDPPARVIGWFDHGMLMAVDVQALQDTNKNTPVH
jgi:hypothetical protein